VRKLGVDPGDLMRDPPEEPGRTSEPAAAIEPPPPQQAARRKSWWPWRRATRKAVGTEQDLGERWEEYLILERRANGVLLGLMILVAISTLLTLVLLVRPQPWVDFVGETFWLGVLCVTAATLGSSLSMLVSVTARVANGVEFANGTKWPEAGDENDHSERFGQRFSAWFPVRPLFGGALGLVILLSATGSGLLKDTTLNVPDAVRDGARWAFVAFLSGFSAKSLLDRLREVVKSVFAA
jgi:hypothetical protein